MVRGSAGDGAHYGDTTLPLPADSQPYGQPDPYGQPGPHGPPGVYGQPGSRVRPGPPGPRGSSGPPVAAPGAFRRKSRWRGLVRAAVTLFAVVILLGVVAFGGLLLITPPVGDARALVLAQNQAHHAAYPGPRVPARFAAALEATEDHRFAEEPGVDPIAVGRVMAGWLTGRGDQGGATLYQQLAKVLYTQGRAGPAVEAEQIALAVKLNFSYSKPEILRLYASVVYFGHGFYGLAAASCGYFGRSAHHLSWPQAALLAGLVQGPSADDPLTFPLHARAREEHVIGRLVATGALTRAQAAAALAAPVSSLVADAGQGCSS